MQHTVYCRRVSYLNYFSIIDKHIMGVLDRHRHVEELNREIDLYKFLVLLEWFGMIYLDDKCQVACNTNIESLHFYFLLSVLCEDDIRIWSSVLYESGFKMTCTLMSLLRRLTGYCLISVLCLRRHILSCLQLCNSIILRRLVHTVLHQFSV